VENLLINDNELNLIKKTLKKDQIEYRFIDSGWANQVYEVDDIIFRFSRFEFTHDQMKREKVALETLSQLGFNEFPKLILTDDSLMAYPKLQGVPLTNEVLIENTDLSAFIAQSIACLLMSIHQLPQDKIKCLEFPYGGDDFWRDIWQPVSEKLSVTARTNSKKYFEHAFSMLKNVQIPKCIIHCDLGSNNILFNQKSKKIGGIIDFGDLSYGDLARDFNGFFRHHGAEFVSLILRYYKIELGDCFWERVEFYARKQKWMVYYYADKFQHEEIKPELLKAIEKEFSA
jgi:aminoglycoside 2''-phosphotransferase